MKDGFLRVAAATPLVQIGNVAENAKQIGQLIAEAAGKGCAAVVFPELSLTAYTCGDLFLDRTLLLGAEKALCELMEKTASMDILCAVGVPVAFQNSLYNCAAVFHRGRLLGLTAKTEIPNYGEFYERRYFSRGGGPVPITYCGQETRLGAGLLFFCGNVESLCFGVEICEDLWTVAPPSGEMALRGATVILNLSCSDEVAGKAQYRRSLVKGQSARVMGAYVYADGGEGESTTDMVFSGHNLIAENGTLLKESALFTTGLTLAEIDLQRIAQERRRRNTFGGSLAQMPEKAEFSYEGRTLGVFSPTRTFPRLPFVPETGLSERCRDILNMQAQGLAARVRHTGVKTVALGLSGGLDSTLAMLVTVRAFDQLGLPRAGIEAISMPCFGTTGRTRSNAEKIARCLGVSFREIPIGAAVSQHFKDIEQPENLFDTTFENAQARERTQVLMDFAGRCGGWVVGTGDLSELALGWATYNGDHMSMYGVNASIPKTLIRHLVNYEARQSADGLQQALLDVLDTPVSPELLPPKDGEIAQKTEELVGPYQLHDFFLYYLLRFGFTPGKIYRMACRSFEGDYSPETVKQWLTVFYRRFFSQQFKRSCLPDGPKVGTVTLSPRGDFRMPSDACAALWLAEIEAL